jgi:hypothetical protein
MCFKNFVLRLKKYIFLITAWRTLFHLVLLILSNQIINLAIQAVMKAFQNKKTNIQTKMSLSTK